MGRGIGQILRVLGEIDSDPDADGETRADAPALEQHARQFGAVDEQIVRPFEPRRDAEIGDCRLCGEARDEAELRAVGDGARVEQQGAAIEITARRAPGASMPPPARRLRLGDNPEAAGIATQRAALGLLAGAVEGVVALDPPAVEGELADGRRGRGQNRLLAAAAAAAVRPAGASVPKMISSAATPSTRRGAVKPLSKAGAGSSKYMILTTRR